MHRDLHVRFVTRIVVSRRVHASIAHAAEPSTSCRAERFRVRVCAGADPLAGKRHDLTEVVPPGPRAAAEAEKVRARLLSQVDEHREPADQATVNQLLDRYLAVVELEESTRKTVRRLPRRPRAPDARRAPAEQAQRRRFSTRSTPSSGAAVCTATGVAEEWTTGRRPSTSATNDASRTSAGRSRRPPPSDPLDPLRGHGTRRALAMDRRQPDRQRATASTACTEAVAALGEGGGAVARGGVEGRGMGRARLARDDDRRAARRALCAAATSPKPQGGGAHD